MTGDINSDADLKEVARNFFSAALETTHDPLGIEDSAGFRLMKGVLFSITKEVEQAQNDLVSRCIKLLGPKAGNEKEITEVAWQRVWESVAGEMKTANVNDIVRHFISDLATSSRREFTFVAPNHVIYFDKGVRSMRIGPVEVVRSNQFFSNIKRKHSNRNLNLEVGSNLKVNSIQNGMEIELPPLCWSVTVTAASRNVEEEASWLINVALSLLRLSYPKKQYVFFPHSNDVEDSPISETRDGPGGIIVTDQTLSGGGHFAPKVYVVDADVLKVLEEDWFKEKAQAIFATRRAGKRKEPLSSRFGQGLGWLTRGRQAADRAERFLFFFTAIEALLASDDTTVPIVQTMSRHASVVLEDEPNVRYELAKRIRDLYAKRSALVHRGLRDVSWTEAKHVHQIAEAIYIRVLEQCDFKQDLRSFHLSLAAASYGSAWPKLGFESR